MTRPLTPKDRQTLRKQFPKTHQLLTNFHKEFYNKFESVPDSEAIDIPITMEHLDELRAKTGNNYVLLKFTIHLLFEASLEDFINNN